MRTWRALGALTAAFAVVVAVGAVLVARENRLDTRDAALRAAVDTAAFVGLGLDRDLGPALRRGQLSAEQVREFEATLAIDAGRRPLRRLSIWRRDGRIVYSTDRARIGRLEPLNRQVRAALAGRSATRLCETAEACERDADASTPNIASFVPLQPGGPATRPPASMRSRSISVRCRPPRRAPRGGCTPSSRAGRWCCGWRCFR